MYKLIFKLLIQNHRMRRENFQKAKVKINTTEHQTIFPIFAAIVLLRITHMNNTYEVETKLRVSQRKRMYEKGQLTGKHTKNSSRSSSALVFSHEEQITPKSEKKLT